MNTANGDTVVNGSREKQHNLREKPSAPINVDYAIKGSPAIGEPVEVELTFTSSQSDFPVYASYRIADPDALSFAATPAEKMAIGMQQAKGEMKGVHRVRVIPHRAGRHQLNVMTEIHADIGPLVNSTTVVFEVPGSGTAFQSKQDRREPDRELQVDPKGEAVISMPATEE